MSNRRTIIKIQRRGGEDNDAIIERHARCIISEIFSTRLANTLRITIKLRAGLDKKILGNAMWRDLSKSKTARSKHYTIHIQRDSDLVQQLRTLTHELKHVEQMATGRLACRRTYGSLGIFWREVGQKGPAEKFECRNGEPILAWHLRPWEKEAIAADQSFLFLAENA
jgi:hypothetical protein